MYHQENNTFVNAENLEQKTWRVVGHWGEIYKIKKWLIGKNSRKSFILNEVKNLSFVKCWN